jgi:hypothetical protein
MAKGEQLDVVVRVIAELPADPEGRLTIGLQRDDALIDPVRVSASSVLVVEPTFRVEQLPDGTPNFLGPFAHGPRSARFVYLVWRRSGAPLGRSKVPLTSINWDHVSSGQTPELRVRLVDGQGGPRFATVRPS